MAVRKSAAKPAAKSKQSASAAKPSAAPSRNDPAVVAYLDGLDHPLKPVVEAIRRLILAADPGICEGIKWNAPSFHFKEYFATAGVRPNEKFVRVVLHTGAKVRDNTKADWKIADPAGLLKWHATERASATFADVAAVKANGKALTDIVKQWIRQM